MKCRKFKTLLALYIGNDLPLKQIGRLENHLSQCPKCKEELNVLETSQEVVKEISKLDMPEELWEDLWPIIQQKVAEEPSSHRRFFHSNYLKNLAQRPVLAFTLVSFLLLATSTFLLLSTPQKSYRIEPTDLRHPISLPQLAKEKIGKHEISVYLDENYPIINYAGNPDTGIMAFETSDPKTMLVWIFDDSFDLGLGKLNRGEIQ